MSNKWSDEQKLSVSERRNRHMEDLHGECEKALKNWNEEFPNRQIAPDRFRKFLDAALALNSLHDDMWIGIPIDDDGKPKPLPPGVPAGPCDWARRPYSGLRIDPPSETPQNNGERLVFELAYFGPLFWGWRSPKKGKLGGLMPGVLQIIFAHRHRFDRDRGMHIELFLDSVDLKGKATRKVAEEYVEWDDRGRERQGLEPIKIRDLESIDRAIQKRIARRNPR